MPVGLSTFESVDLSRVLQTS